MTTGCPVRRRIARDAGQSAPNRWWRSFASAAHRLLVGPEPADTPVNGLLALLPRRWRRLLVLAGALLLVVLGAADWAELDRHTAFHRLLPVGLLAVAHVAPVAMARRRPLLAWRISVLATVLTPAVAPLEVSSGLPWPPVVGVAHLLVLVQVAAAVPRGVAVLATVVDGAAMAAITVASTTPDLGLVQGGLVLIVLVAGLGVSVGAWQATSGRLAEQRRRIVQEQERRAVVEERNRIARELHDVVAHHLSMIAVRAETAPFRRPGLDGDGRGELAGVATDARSALVDMRRLLGVLRTDHDVRERAPQPQTGRPPRAGGLRAPLRPARADARARTARQDCSVAAGGRVGPLPRGAGGAEQRQPARPRRGRPGGRPPSPDGGPDPGRERAARPAGGTGIR